MKISDLLRRSHRLEVGSATRRNPRPGFRWVMGWEVQDPRTGQWSTPMRLKYAREEARQLINEMKGKKT